MVPMYDGGPTTGGGVDLQVLHPQVRSLDPLGGWAPTGAAGDPSLLRYFVAPPVYYDEPQV